MCDDHVGPSRRQFLYGAATFGAAAALGAHRLPPARLPLRSSVRAVSVNGESAYSMAMHIHSSFSEQQGSMAAQLFQAQANAVDVCWWTDHDHRMDGLDYRDVTHFTSFNEVGAAGQGGKWSWEKRTSGPLTSASTGGIVSSPSSPNDPVRGGSLHLLAKSSSTATAKFGYYAESHPAGWNYRDNLTGQSVEIDVMLTAGWSRGYLEYLITTSDHPATNGRPSGTYTLSYRFTPGGTASVVANGINGVITVPISAAGEWQTCTLTPSENIAALWPDLDYRDFAMWEIQLSAASTGDTAQGYFDYMRFNRTISGQAFFSQQADMMTGLAATYPTVTQQQGLEVGPWLPHLNWFGPNIALPDYSGVTSANFSEFAATTVIPEVHASGGLMSFNHPFGYTDGPLLSAAAQNTKLAQTASVLLSEGVLGCDLLEVGYALRGQCDTAHHLALWDIMSRNAIFLTGNGVSDDHAGLNWFGPGGNNWVTMAWAASTGMTDLLSALASGRAWCASMSGYTGALDMLVDGSVPMGAASVSSVTSRSLTATATSLPAGATLQVLQGAVDYAGQNALSSDAAVIGGYTAADLATGQVSQSVDTSADSFVRLEVVASSGAIIAASNPVWLLQNSPPNGIPAPRDS
jgi:hypothetical protein